MSSHHSQAELSSVPITRTGRTEQQGGLEDQEAVPAARAGFLLPTVSLWWRELVRFYRQPSRWVGVLLSPLVFWLVIGSGLGSSFRGGGIGGGRGYLEYFFPGTLILILLFTSIFCMMSVIEDRREGFLSSVLVSPAPRASLVMGKVLGMTLVEVLLAYYEVPIHIMLTILLGLSVIKAALIIAYFMHLRFERMSLVLTLIPMLVVCICLLFVFFPDSFRSSNLRYRFSGSAVEQGH